MKNEEHKITDNDGVCLINGRQFIGADGKPLVGEQWLAAHERYRDMRHKEVVQHEVAAAEFDKDEVSALELQLGAREAQLPWTIASYLSAIALGVLIGWGVL